MKVRGESQELDRKRSAFLDWLKKLGAGWPVYLVYSALISVIIILIFAPALSVKLRNILRYVVSYVAIISTLFCLDKSDKGHAALLLLLGILFYPARFPALDQHIIFCIFAIFAFACVIHDLDKKERRREINNRNNKGPPIEITVKRKNTPPDNNKAAP